jgi:hypothetical protein
MEVKRCYYLTGYALLIITSLSLLFSNSIFLLDESQYVAPQILIVLFLIYLFDNIIQLISLRSLWYYGGW